MSQTHYLPPQKLKIRLKEGVYILKMDGQKIPIAPPKRALPHSNPDEFIVLFDENGQEIGVIKRIEELEPDSRLLLQTYLEQLYQSTQILRIIDVEREPLSGQVRWSVEIELSDAQAQATPPETTGIVRLLSRTKSDNSNDEPARRELVFMSAGSEDVQNSRYPQIFLTDIDGNRYEIPDCEALDLNSRRIAQQYF